MKRRRWLLILSSVVFLIAVPSASANTPLFDETDVVAGQSGAVLAPTDYSCQIHRGVDKSSDGNVFAIGKDTCDLAIQTLSGTLYITDSSGKKIVQNTFQCSSCSWRAAIVGPVGLRHGATYYYHFDTTLTLWYASRWYSDPPKCTASYEVLNCHFKRGFVP